MSLKDSVKGFIKELFGEERKMTLQFSTAMTKLVDELAKKANTNRVQIIRRAIALYSYVNEEVIGTNKKLAIISEDEKIEKTIDLS